MVTKEIIITGKQGLESKPAALFIQKASNYKSSIWIEREERRVNAKSLLGLLSLGIGKGSTLMISAEGEDEQQAVSELEEYLKTAD